MTVTKRLLACLLVLSSIGGVAAAQLPQPDREKKPVVIPPELRDLPEPLDPMDYPEPSLSEPELEAWYEYYYLHPDPDLLLERVMDMAAYGWFSREYQVRWSTHAAFLAEVMMEEFQSDPLKRWEWARTLSQIDIEQQRVVWYAFWMQNDDEGWQVLAALSENLPLEPGVLPNGQPMVLGYRDQLAALSRIRPPEWREGTPKGAGQVLMAMGQFRATGDPAYIERLLRSLRFASGEVMDPTNGQYLAAGRQAALALQSEVPRHERGMKTVEIVAPDLQVEGQKVLEEIWPKMIQARKDYLEQIRGTPAEQYQQQGP